MRKLPVYFLLDTSGSMHGEPIQALNKSLNKMVNFLLCNPSAIECLLLSFITFNMGGDQSSFQSRHDQQGLGC